MKNKFKRLLAAALIAAMTIVPSVSSLAAEEWTLPLPDGFFGFFPAEWMPPFTASPSDAGTDIPDMLPGLFPGGNGQGIPSAKADDFIGAWGNMFAGDEENGLPDGGWDIPEWGIFDIPADFGTLTRSDAEDVYDTGYTAETVTGESEAVTDEEAEAEYYAKLLVYDLNKASDDELLAGYIDRLFYGVPEDQPFSEYQSYWRRNLSDDEADFYDAVQEFAEEIAAGDEEFPVFDARDSAPSVRLGRAQLGLPDDASYNDWFEASLSYYLENVIRVNPVINYVCRDDPFDFYWASASYAASFAAYIEDDSCVISLVSLFFPVEEGYEGDYVSDIGGYAVYNADNREMIRARYAAENAQEIVQDHSGETQSEMLASFTDEIILLSAYEDEAVKPEDIDYEDPWQIVYVFDKDPSTEVTIEAYSRALEYLCGMAGIYEDT